MADASAVMAFDKLIADAGYDSEANYRFCRETLGVHSLFPVKKRRSIKVIAITPYWQEMHRLLNDPEDAASKRAYRQSWKVETVMSVAKRRWGEALSARTDLQRSQTLLMGAVYNVNCFVLLSISA